VQEAIPILIGGESEVALDRAARIGDGWIGMNHTPTSAASAVDRLRSAEARVGRSSSPCTVTIGGSIISAEEFREYKQAGVDRVILAPWNRVRDTLSAIEQFGADFLQSGPN
jgi:alkanesulfonate monooxygenase SsuD/methylene tetrahydromethanopterin reductase-like flavin-dependent oxidoreductase (luciferase family)